MNEYAKVLVRKKIIEYEPYVGETMGEHQMYAPFRCHFRYSSTQLMFLTQAYLSELSFRRRNTVFHDLETWINGNEGLETRDRLKDKKGRVGRCAEKVFF